MEADEFPHLPHEIVLAILTNLPVKSLFRFRCVNKQWRDSISTTHFTKLHLIHTQQRPITTNHLTRLAILESHDPPSSVSIRSIDFETQSNQSITELHNSFKYSYPNAKLLSSCNGLVLLGITEKTFIVWNPSTREYKHMNCPFLGSGDFHTLSGIGYEIPDDDNRVVDGYRVVLAIGRLGRIFVHRYCSADAHSRRIIRLIFPYKICMDRSGAVVNGVPHWMVNRVLTDGEECPVVIYFDFAAEVFVELPQPNYGSESKISKFDLGVLRGWLCVVCHREDHVEVLALTRDCAMEPWTKLFAIPYDTGSLSFETLTPLCFTKNGELLMEIDRKRIVVYNLEQRSYRFVEFSHNDNGFKVLMYVESLVSPDGASRCKRYVENMSI